MARLSKDRRSIAAVAECQIQAEDRAALRQLEQAFLGRFFESDVVTRSLEQNDVLHVWCRKIAQHCKENGVANLTEESVKELLLLGLGNKRELKVPGMPPQVVAMRSHKYRQRPGDLSAAEKRRGDISMMDLLSKIEAWATALGLNLQKDDAA